MFRKLDERVRQEGRGLVEALADEGGWSARARRALLPQSLSANVWICNLAWVR